jgi:hypothetical protein
MKTTRLYIAFGAVTAFEVRCKSAALPACCRAAEWQATRAWTETKKAVPNLMGSLRKVRWLADEELRVQRQVTPNRVTTILAERSR